MQDVDIFEKLTEREIYRSVFEYLEKRVRSKPELRQRASVEKSLTLGWCLRESEMITDYLIINLKKKTYHPGIKHRYFVQLDKRRAIVSSNWVDRIFEYALGMILFKEFNHKFSNNLYSYRKNFSNRQPIKKLQKLILDKPQETLYLTKYDIKSYTDSIDPDLLMSEIREQIGEQDDYLWILLRETFSPKFINCDIESKQLASTGVPTGSFLSNFAANLYLSKIDHILSEKLSYYSRFGDDLLLADYHPINLQAAKAELLEFLNQRKLLINDPKTKNIAFGITVDNNFARAEKIKHLGFIIFTSGKIFLESKKILKIKNQIESHLFQVKKNLANFDLTQDEILLKIIEKYNFIIKNFSLIPNLQEILRFCDHNDKIKNLDQDLARIIIAVAYSTKKRLAFRKISYKKIHKLGFLSLLNFKNFYPRRHEIFKNFGCK